ncbi:hypothetical protein SISSUDRAFT_794526 [Sistotremastrum suecicum HHB10207 ss-3]|uniref:Uncharacterized protein n=1 Tax=Sistotremastrum suecicum HHB10207 ss-3 TaxID=1314776 RepID=A0A166HPA7_9AGAM|nr:hypothetical protein SISSUDRAFT_794526 [Sistotremastrum suecicum HHB10207 ss-3]
MCSVGWPTCLQSSTCVRHEQSTSALAESANASEAMRPLVGALYAAFDAAQGRCIVPSITYSLGFTTSASERAIPLPQPSPASYLHPYSINIWSCRAVSVAVVECAYDLLSSAAAVCSTVCLPNIPALESFQEDVSCMRRRQGLGNPHVKRLACLVRLDRPSKAYVLLLPRPFSFFPMCYESPIAQTLYLQMNPQKTQ